jgi:hypothetical protein
MPNNLVSIIGLSVNLIGSITIACSVRENPGGANQMVDGKKIFLASVYLRTFRWGIFLLILGFVIQILAIIK